MRIEEVLIRQKLAPTLGAARCLCEGGQVFVNGDRVSSGHLVQTSDIVRVKRKDLP